MQVTSLLETVTGGHGNEEVEDNYDILREAVMEHWTTLKLYYRAAADEYVKGNIELSDKLVKEVASPVFEFLFSAFPLNDLFIAFFSHFSLNDGEAISINLNDHDPKEAVRLLKTQLKSMSGIPCKIPIAFSNLFCYFRKLNWCESSLFGRILQPFII
ncbi:hypothetical protein L1987_54917 [Smallanthus sonchifolius]|uniref:Uncharacterized protein n=1 Tax=Smallanthus sonchifolius TaxID=185202 RepID=A0ACB9E8J2_9ASTR|nr:hypothetical protein L1987_54917 [Smallanthus sonchifolius]